MNDRELLELAAKAAGHEQAGLDALGYPLFIVDGVKKGWNPLADDGDALRLAVKLGLRLDIDPCGTWVIKGKMSLLTPFEVEPSAESATRRAIVRAAAAIGEAMR